MFKRLSFLLLFLGLQIFPVFSMEEIQSDLFDYVPLYALEGLVQGCCFSPDGKLIAVASSVGLAAYNLCILDAGTGELLHRLNKPDSEVLRIEFSPDSSRLAFASGNHAYIFDLNTGEMLPSLEGYICCYLSSLAFNFDGSLIFAGAADTSAFIWDVESGKLLHKLDVPKAVVAKFSFDDTCLTTVSHDCSVRVWDVVTGGLLQTMILEGRCEDRDAISAKFNPDGRFIAAIQSDHVLRGWNRETGELRWDFNDIEDPVFSLSFNSDGRFIFVGSCSGVVRAFDVESGELLQRLKKDMGGATLLRFSPNDKFVVSKQNYDPNSSDNFGITYVHKNRKATLQEIAFASAMHPRLGQESLVSVLPQHIVREILNHI